MATEKQIRTRRNKFTDEKKAKFCELIANGHTVISAAESIGVGRTTAYDHLRDDEAFRAQYQRADEAATHRMERELYKRAVDGDEEDVYYNGEVVGKRVRKSDTLLIFSLKGRLPEKYRDRVETKHTGSVMVKTKAADYTDDELAAIANGELTPDSLKDG